MADRSARRAARATSKRRPSSTSTSSARRSPAIATSSSRTSTRARMLDGQFDFPLRAQLVQTRAPARRGTMSDLIALHGRERRLLRHRAVMSTFIGNHDVPRTIHFAEDTPLWTDVWADGKDRSWTNQPGQPSSAQRRTSGSRSAFALLMTNRGVPLIYYGDEVGMAGAGDPDNRRMMQWTRLLAPAQSALLAQGEEARHHSRARTRRCAAATRTTLVVRQRHLGLPDGRRQRQGLRRHQPLRRDRDGQRPARGRAHRSDDRRSAHGPSISVPPRTARVMTK